MKILVVFLSLTIIFLNGIPCCWDACTEDETVVPTDENANSREGACSPFLTCGSCAGFILEQELPEISSHEISPLQILSKHENPFLSSDYSGIIWAPPKKIYFFQKMLSV